MKALITVLFAASMAASAMAQSESSALRAEMQKHYRAFDEAIADKNFNAFIALFHPSYSEVDTQGGSRTFAQFKTNAKNMFASMKDAVVSSNVKHAQGGLAGEATAWVEVTVRFNERRNGKIVPMKVTKRYADTLKRTADGWKFTYSQELPIDEPWPF